MSNSISGQQLLNDLGLSGIELFSDYVKKGLQPYNKLGKQISPADVLNKITNITGLTDQYHEMKFTRLEMGKVFMDEVYIPRTKRAEKSTPFLPHNEKGEIDDVSNPL